MENIHITHRNCAFNQRWFDVSLCTTQYEDVGTPSIPLNEEYLEWLAKDLHKTRQDIIGYGLIGRYEGRDEPFWKKYVEVPYRKSLEAACDRLVDVPTIGYGGVVDRKFCPSEERINIAGGYFECCLSDTIESLARKLKKTQKIFVIPELTVCFCQPGNVTFVKTLEGLKKILPIEIDMKHLNDLK